MTVCTFLIDVPKESQAHEYTELTFKLRLPPPSPRLAVSWSGSDLGLDHMNINQSNWLYVSARAADVFSAYLGVKSSLSV